MRVVVDSPDAGKKKMHRVKKNTATSMPGKHVMANFITVWKKADFFG